MIMRTRKPTEVKRKAFMAWFAKEFVVAQDHLARSSYDGDPVWERGRPAPPLAHRS